jgi:hypothetical protein
MDRNKYPIFAHYSYLKLSLETFLKMSNIAFLCEKSTLIINAVPIKVAGVIPIDFFHKQQSQLKRNAGTIEKLCESLPRERLNG